MRGRVLESCIHASNTYSFAIALAVCEGRILVDELLSEN